MSQTLITDHGAVSDGKSVNTTAIQEAIDARSAQGGGRVVVPTGRFVTGTIFLKDNVDFHLAPGSELIGSPDMNDYNDDDHFPTNAFFPSENTTGAHLVLAVGAKNVSITGRGSINGNSEAFFGPPLKPGWNFSIKARRPGQMVYFSECENVLVEGVELVNTTYWTLFLHGCAGVRVHGVRINNPPQTQNGDGIDVDCSSDVVISDCLIESGDDCVTLRGYNETLTDKSKICENVTVTNCVLSSPCNAIRVGVGDGVVRNAVFSNIVIKNTRNGVCLVSKYSEKHASGTTIENVRFNNFVMETVMPFYVASGFDATAEIRNVCFSDIRATGSKTSFIYGNDNVALKNLQFHDIDVEMTGGAEHMGDDEIDPTTHREWEKGTNAAFFVARTDETRFEDVRLTWRDVDAPWKHAFIVRNAENLTIDERRLSPPPTGSVEAMIKREKSEL